MPAFTVALIVIVVLPPSGAKAPSPLTVLPVVIAVPVVAVTLTWARPTGKTSTNS